MSINEKLFSQFPPVSTNEWMEKIAADLKGADFIDKMVWKTREGFDVMPFYRREDIENLKYLDSLPGKFPFIRGKRSKNNYWRVRQNIPVTNYSDANKKALEIIGKGVDSIGFFITDTESINQENFDTLLKDISAEKVELNFLSNGKADEIVRIFVSYLKRTGADPEKITGAIETDPLGRIMLNGTLCIPVSKGFDYLSAVARQTSVLPGISCCAYKRSAFC